MGEEKIFDSEIIDKINESKYEESPLAKK